MKFVIYQGNKDLLSLELDAVKTARFSCKHSFQELDRLGFLIESYDPDLEYEFYIGDNPVVKKPWPYRSNLDWGEDFYFANSFGKIRLSMIVNTKDSPKKREICAGNMYCYPSKMTLFQYRQMLQDISYFSKGLIIDIVSKAQSMFGWKTTTDVQEMSGIEEHVIIEQLMNKFEPVLERINQSPDTGIEVRKIQQKCYGYETFTQRSIANITSSGINPRQKGMQKPFRCEIQKKIISYDTWENRQIFSFCQFISFRLLSVINKVEIQIDMIHKEKFWRKIAPSGLISLWNLEDKPRIDQLKTSIQSCRKLLNRVNSYYERFRFLANLPHVQINLRPTPKFLGNLFYSYAYSMMADFISSNGILFDKGSLEQKLKNTSKLYEYWVYLLLYTYICKRLDVEIEQKGRLFSKDIHNNAYVLHIQSGDYTSFKSSTGLRLVLHYEPTFFSKSEAINKGYRLYRSTFNTAHPLQPDFLIEIQSGPEERPKLEYGIVIDCKYSKKISQDQWDNMTKYQSQLFESVNHTNVANQLWLFYPGKISEWKTNFENKPIEELVYERIPFIAGELSISPVNEEKKDFSQNDLFDILDESIGTAIKIILKQY